MSKRDRRPARQGTRLTTIRLPPDLIQLLDDVAGRRDRTRSSLIKELLRAGATALNREDMKARRVHAPVLD